MALFGLLGRHWAIGAAQHRDQGRADCCSRNQTLIVVLPTAELSRISRVKAALDFALAANGRFDLPRRSMEIMG